MAEKTNFPEVLLVGGGNHITQEHETIMADPYFDIIVRGEGEYPMLEMVDHLERKKSFSGIKGLVWRDKDGAVKINETINGVQTNNGKYNLVETADDMAYPSTVSY